MGIVIEIKDVKFSDKDTQKFLVDFDVAIIELRKSIVEGIKEGIITKDRIKHGMSFGISIKNDFTGKRL